jgi:hypothetical protein
MAEADKVESSADAPRGTDKAKHLFIFDVDAVQRLRKTSSRRRQRLSLSSMTVTFHSSLPHVANIWLASSEELFRVGQKSSLLLGH